MFPCAATVSAVAALNWLSTAVNTTGSDRSGTTRAVMSISVLSGPSPVAVPMSGVATITKPR